MFALAIGLIFFILATLTSCGGDYDGTRGDAIEKVPQNLPSWTPLGRPPGYLFDTFRFHDDSKSTTCWVIVGNSTSAIDCIPDKELER